MGVVVCVADADVTTRDFCARPASVDLSCVGAAIYVDCVSVIALFSTDSVTVTILGCVGGESVCVSGFGEVGEIFCETVGGATVAVDCVAVFAGFFPSFIRVTTYIIDQPLNLWFFICFSKRME